MSKKNKEPINVYWAIEPSHGQIEDWSFLYPKPKSLFSELIEERSNPKNKKSYFLCPAVSAKFKKTLTFNNAVTSSYEFGKNQQEFYINPTSDQFINAKYVREPAITKGATFLFSLNYLFFADDSLDVSFTAPYFHEPKYVNNGTVLPGEFNIGQWFRPYNFEVQMWKESGTFSIEDGEPLFYVEFKTDRPIVLHRFSKSEKLLQYQLANMHSNLLFGPFQTLSEKYEKFKQVGFKEKILTEIKKNLIDEVPYKF